MNAELSDFFRVPKGADSGRLGEPAKADAGLVDGYCARCDRTVPAIGVIYADEHPEHHDGVSEWECPRCQRREGRWTGKVLTGDSSEPRQGEETHESIKAEEATKPLYSQPR